MRHKVKTKKIGKDASHRRSILRNLTKALLYKERVETTVGKAKVFQSFAEKIITRAKIDNLHNRRMIYRDIRDTRLLKKLFENIGKRYIDRPGGYTRILKLNQRKGDASEMCLIELVEEKLSSESTPKSEKKESNKKSKSEKEASKKEIVSEETPVKQEQNKKEVTTEVVKETTEIDSSEEKENSQTKESPEVTKVEESSKE